MRFFVRLFLFVTLSFEANALQSDYAFRQLGIEQGLSQSMLTAILQDHQGFMWFGTRDGLNRYDGYSFTVFKADPRVANSVSDNHITALFEDSHRNLWVGTMHGGLQVFRRNYSDFVRVNLEGGLADARFVSTITGDGDRQVVVSYLSGHVVRITLPPHGWAGDTPLASESHVVLQGEKIPVPFHVAVTSDKRLWLSGSRGLKVERLMESGEQEDVFASYPTYVVAYEGGTPLPPKRDDTFSPFQNDTQEIKEDDLGHLWMTSSLGLYHINSEKKEIFLYRIGLNTTSLLPVTNRSGERQIWVGTLKNGLAVFQPHSREVQFRPNSSFEGDELADMLFRVMCRGRDGTVWLGTNGRGVFSHSPNFSLFTRGKMPEAIRDVKASKSIYTLMGVGDGHEILFSTLNEFVHFDPSSPGTRPSYSDKELVARSMAAGADGTVWFGNSKGLFRYDWRQKVATRVWDTGGEVILSVYVDADETVWYTTYAALCSYHPVTRRQTRSQFFPDQKGWMETHLYSFIQPDIDGSLWVGTTNGLFHFDRDALEFKRTYLHKKEEEKGLISNEVKSVLPDPIQPADYLWIGTPVGLCKMDKKTGDCQRFSTADGLPNNTIYGILSDEEGRLWVSTNHGLSMFEVESKTFMNFDIANGLQSNEFNTGAFHKSAKGELFFGGINGYNRFFAKDVWVPQGDIPIVISSVQLLDAGNPQDYHFVAGKKNVLRHDQNHVSISLAVLDYATPGKIRYAYRMANQDTVWREIGNSRTVTLTNLSPGKYVFQGRGTDGFGRWSDQVTEMTFEVSPPWWNSLLARVTYVVLFALTLFLFWKRYQNRILAEQRLETERQKAMAILELDQVKTRFLANITHEFRTPLTLINGHIERLKSQGHFPDAAVQFGEMERNSSHLLQLINQLVDLSKLESGELKLKLTPKDILNDLRVFVFSFNSYAELKNIHLHLELDPATEQRLLNQKLCYDENVLLTIVNNLLSNACKFTEREGTIVFSFRVEEPALRIHIRVSDTGPGIPPEELPKLFDRFYQSDSSMVRSYEGSGIGLSLVKELAILHGGGVSVESQLGVGSTFHVWLQASEAGEEETEASNASVARQRGADRTETSNVASEQEELPLLVLVEDHPDLRRFIRESLGEGYRFAEAVNGAEGLQLASHSIPDLVISDVMMPEMDGFAFCSELKKQTLTSHIPVILLTARVGLDDKLTGLERGADDYLTKPFSARELRLRVHNMLTSRRSLLEKHGLRQDKQKIAAAALPGESVFVGQLVDAITRHMSEPTLAVEGLAEAMNLSSSQLQRKLRAICGKSVQKLIQEVRMENAIELLASGQKNVSEVAFIVGYDDPGYFSKVFKKNFGFLPSERERIKTFFSA